MTNNPGTRKTEVAEETNSPPKVNRRHALSSLYPSMMKGALQKRNRLQHESKENVSYHDGKLAAASLRARLISWNSMKASPAMASGVSLRIVVQQWRSTATTRGCSRRKIESSGNLCLPEDSLGGYTQEHIECLPRHAVMSKKTSLLLFELLYCFWHEIHIQLE